MSATSEISPSVVMPRGLRWLVLCSAIAMSVGWGLRGYIGGGTFGAMIPGALVALVICRGLGVSESLCACVAAFGAVGVGFGGQETYGLTVRMVTNGGDTFCWGLLGLTLKGAMWGLLGGAMIGVALIAPRVSRRDLGLALVVLVAATWLGWRCIDDPKLLYFSNLRDKPRPEVWAGLLTGGMAFLLMLSWRVRAAARVPWSFAVAGFIGGGIGFGGGGALYAAGMNLGFDASWYPGWKQMEFTFGLCFGAALALAAWSQRAAILERRAASDEPAALDRYAWWPLVSVLVATAILFLSARLRVRFGFTVGGAALLALVWWSRSAAWQVALTLTIAGFALDLGDSFTTNFLPDRPLPAKIVALVLAAAAAVIVVRRERSGRPMAQWALTFLLWTAVAASLCQAVLQRKYTVAVALPLIAFLVGGVIVSRLWREPSPTRT